MISALTVRELLSTAWVAGSRSGSATGLLEAQEFVQRLFLALHLLQAIFEGLQCACWALPAGFIVRHAQSVRNAALGVRAGAHNARAFL
jgi:hypothetical protein